MFAGLEVKRPREKTPANLHADFAASSPPLQALHATTFSSPSTLEGIHSHASVHHIAGQVSLGPHRDSPHSTPHTPLTHMPWVPALRQEPTDYQGWLKVTQWPAGLPRLDQSQAPGSALLLAPKLLGLGDGELGSNQGLCWAQRSRSSPFNNPSCLPCARLQPSSRPADKEKLVPASTNMCAFRRVGPAQAAGAELGRPGGAKGLINRHMK